MMRHFHTLRTFVAEGLKEWSTWIGLTLLFLVMFKASWMAELAARANAATALVGSMTALIGVVLIAYRQATKKEEEPPKDDPK